MNRSWTQRGPDEFLLLICETTLWFQRTSWFLQLLRYCTRSRRETRSESPSQLPCWTTEFCNSDAKIKSSYNDLIELKKKEFSSKGVVQRKKTLSKKINFLNIFWIVFWNWKKKKAPKGLSCPVSYSEVKAIGSNSVEEWGQWYSHDGMHEIWDTFLNCPDTWITCSTCS